MVVRSALSSSLFGGISAILAAALLSGCANLWDPGDVKGLSVDGDGYSEVLYEEYLRLAELEREEHDWADTEYFLRRAIEAAGNKLSGPEAIEARVLPAEMQAPMSLAREELVLLLAAGARRSGRTTDRSSR